MIEPRLSMNPLSGGYPSSQISYAGRSPSPRGLYSNNKASHFPGGNAGYSQTYNAVIPEIDQRLLLPSGTTMDICLC